MNSSSSNQPAPPAPVQPEGNDALAPQQDQSPIMQAVQPPKKSKAGLIVGIIIGSLLLLGLIGLALWYFLVWKSPQNVVTRAVAKSLVAEKSISSGSMTIEAEKAKVNIDIKTVSDAPKAKATATIKVTPDGMDRTFEADFEGVIGDDGAIYFKVEGVEEAISGVFEAAIEAGIEESATSEQIAFLETPQGQAYLGQMKEQAMSQFQPVIDAVDGNWVKITADDITGSNSDEQRCVIEAVKLFQNDRDFRKQVSGIYQKHPFYTIGDKVEDKNGMKGYTITLDKSASDRFISELQTVAFSDKLRDCKEELSTSASSSSSTYGDASYKLWVDGSENVRSIEMTGKSDVDKISITMDVEYGKTEAVEVPSDAKTVTELKEELESLSSDGSLQTDLLPFSTLSI